MAAMADGGDIDTRNRSLRVVVVMCGWKQEHTFTTHKLALQLKYSKMNTRFKIYVNRCIQRHWPALWRWRLLKL